MRPSDESPARRKLALAALAMVCTVAAIIRGGPSGDFIAGTGSGVLAMLLALHVASRRPAWSGGVPGLLGGMVAAAIGIGWRSVSSWSGFVGGVIAILTWAILDREALVPRGREATE